jgi:cytidine deaminase
MPYIKTMEGFTKAGDDGHFDHLDTESKYLGHKAKDATNHAHAPYSKFLVGAAVLLEDGTVVTGANYENAALPSGMCAERVALYAAASQHPEKRINKMVIVARRKGSKDLVPATSCGSCRQVMLEFEINQGKPFEVVMQNNDHQWIVAESAASLLPFSYTPHNMEHITKK